MKPTLLFAMLSMVFAVPEASAVTELETLRARCAEQERQIRHLEEQVLELQSGGSSTRRSTPTVASTSAKEASTQAAIHTVRAGESLERIARRAGCSPTTLAKANGLKLSSVIHPGQKLKLPGTAVAQNPAPAAPATRAIASSATPLAGKTHKIREGETYSSISRKYRIPVASLLAANPQAKATSLRPGQVIRLSATAPDTPLASQTKPAGPGTSAPAPAPAAPRTPTPPATPARSTTAVATNSSRPPSHTPQTSKPSPAPATMTVSAPAKPAEKAAETATTNSSQEQTLSPTNPEKKIRSVTIEGEMTYGEFATTHGTDTNRLNDLNGLDLTNATVLAKGSELYVPAQP